ncbi:heavy metal translocating P-type ATPase [Corynebacterium sp. 335C]
MPASEKDLAELDERVTRAIAEARAAAGRLDGPRRPSGRDEGDMARRLAERTGFGRTSFALVLEGMESGVDAMEAEEVLEEFDDVVATVVFQTSRAWITAPDHLNPDLLVEALEDIGLRARLTRSSLRRRAIRLGEVPRRRPAIPAAVRRLDEARMRRREEMQRNASVSSEVLFTARSLVTRTRFVGSLLLTIPVLAMSLNVGWQFPWWQWVSAALSTIVVAWGGYPFHRAMVGALRRGLSALDGATSAAILLAWAWSVGELTIGEAGVIGYTTAPTLFAFEYARSTPAELFFDVACGVTTLMLGGRLMTRYNRIRSGQIIRSLRIPPERMVTVLKKVPGSPEPERRRVPVAELHIGEDLMVPAGQVVPVDGTVVGGASRIDVSTLGGPAEPVDAKVGDTVLAGAVNIGAPLKARVARTGSKTRAALMLRWLRHAIRKEDVEHQISVRSASTLVPTTFGLAVAAFGVWWLVTGTAPAAFAVMLAMLVSVAPVALAMTTSTVQRLGILAGAEQGILLRDARTVRALAGVDAAMFNRVGTLTEGDMHVVDVVAARGENPDLVLRVAGALVMDSDHPVSLAIVRACRKSRDAGSGGDIPHWIDVNHPDVDEDGTFTGQIEIPVRDDDGEARMRQVEASLWRPRDLTGLDERTSRAALSGGTPLVVSWRGRVRGVITVSEDIKADAVDAVDELEDMGVETVMLTRDTYRVARRFADRLGISRVYAGIVPGRKSATVREVRAGGEDVVMVGGADVAPSLDAADVGLLLADDRLEMLDDDRALAAADVVVLRTDVSAVPQTIRLARRMRRTMSSNLAFAWGYNIVALAAAAAGILHPSFAAIFMVASGLVVEWRSRAMPRRGVARDRGRSLRWGA